MSPSTNLLLWKKGIPVLVGSNQSTFIYDTEGVELGLNRDSVHDPQRIINQGSCKASQESKGAKHHPLCQSLNCRKY
ncbi:hypothetical protein VIGAN_08245200 [Vigna angularis var. angularis]|uniref:Uncharacterized protein n=1 Tax=Vigna angularis var. angularis TaxID=157739 RepID=A0A0S3SSA4_PHAAN|nr:hypothetical protein VIGAN_08245200 [Vigna angularis var. angularis]